MDWFRSWHGAPTDTAFLVIARRAQVAPGMVSAVYWALLDYASQNNPRGSIAGFDSEAYAEWAGWEEAQVIAIIAAFTTKGKITQTGEIVAWADRQPKREDDSAPRVKAFRERQKALQDDVTQSNAPKHNVTIDKIREDTEQNPEHPTDAPRNGSPEPPPAASAPTAHEGALSYQQWCDKLREAQPKEHAVIALAMFNALYPDAIDKPDYGRIGGAAKQLGGWGRLAELLWQFSAKPPTGDVLAYITEVGKNKTNGKTNGRHASNAPEKMPQTYDEIKAKYVPASWEQIIEH